MECLRCSSSCIKAGKQQNGKQRYYCKKCSRYLQEEYNYNAYKYDIHDQFSRMSRLGCGINKMASFLKISINTLQKWIGKANNLQPESNLESGCIYDIDEIQTCVGRKADKIWITYGWNVKRRIAVALHVGSISSEDLRNVTSKVIALSPSNVNTDNYVAYPNLLKETNHRKGKRKANYIERQHVNLRKDIACLNQKTMCYSKNSEMLKARLKWYFWGEINPYFFLKKN
ncbi:IS1 family transposase [Crocinitomicaceae bacterium CZZ-1]|uniref:IS1 family transposase n=1 Tax=Taishania pollutisoli TaxID=2766479 RepID=A0A8J6PGK6_9FLAO|nr:IS1 family transposase [Taishania pollutisoli]MBC9813993.1 IS1 family transposase [Taishania pollutisoli]